VAVGDLLGHARSAVGHHPLGARLLGVGDGTAVVGLSPGRSYDVGLSPGRAASSRSDSLSWLPGDDAASQATRLHEGGLEEEHAHRRHPHHHLLRHHHHDVPAGGVSPVALLGIGSGRRTSLSGDSHDDDLTTSGSLSSDRRSFSGGGAPLSVISAFPASSSSAAEDEATQRLLLHQQQLQLLQQQLGAVGCAAQLCDPRLAGGDVDDASGGTLAACFAESLTLAAAPPPHARPL